MEKEIWKTYPEFDFIKVSSWGRVRTLDRVVSTKKGMRVRKGHILKQHPVRGGYMAVSFRVNGKQVNRSVHRLVAQAFVPNPDNLPEVNHKDNDRTKNCVSNLEWCTHEYNIAYREKYGTSAKEYTKVLNRPVYAVNLKTQEVSRFESQREAGRELGVAQSRINYVLKGRYNQAGGYWFTEDDGGDLKIDKNKLRKVKVITQFRSGIYAVNLKTLEVAYFESQCGAGRELVVNQGNINSVLKGRYKTAGGYWFTNADENAVENTRAKFGDEVADKVEVLMSERELQPA